MCALACVIFFCQTFGDRIFFLTYNGVRLFTPALPYPPPIPLKVKWSAKTKCAFSNVTFNQFGT